MYSGNTYLAQSQHCLDRSPRIRNVTRANINANRIPEILSIARNDEEAEPKATLNSDRGCPIFTSPVEEQPFAFKSTDDNARDAQQSIQIDTSQPHRKTPMSPEQNTKSLSASPAALFLSAFSPRIPPAPLEDSQGQTIGGYVLGDIVGHGGFSVIRRAVCSSGGIVAVKIIRCSDLAKQPNAPLLRKRIQHEASVWASLSHEHILPLFSTEHTSFADYFITLLCPAGSLFDILKRDGRPALPQDDAGMMFRQVVRGLRYLHEIALCVHRDIKLENILVDEMGICRIADFGMTRKIGDVDEDDVCYEGESDDQDQSHPMNQALHRTSSLALPSTKRQNRSSFQQQIAVVRHSSVRHRNSTSTNQPAHPAYIFQPGSLPYAAPELLLPQGSQQLLPHPAQDIWALGIVLYGLLTGRLPFVDSFEPRLQMKILNGVFELPKDIGRGAERVLKGCLDRSAPNRWTASMIDEVSWGVGWGAEGDEVTPADSEEEEEYVGQCANSSRSVPRPQVVEPAPPVSPITPDWQQGDSVSRPSLEVASRRSSSRVQRSRSRAPIPVTPTRSMTRHQSRGESPSFHALNSSILGVNPVSYGESALLDTPHKERGRQRIKRVSQFTSRSPSPSVAPSTPIDIGSRPPSPTSTLEGHTNDLIMDPRRGRPNYTRAAQSDNFYHAVVDSDLSLLDENSVWENPQLSSMKEKQPAIGLPYDDVKEQDNYHSSRHTLIHRKSRSRSPYRSPYREGKKSDGLPPLSTGPWSKQTLGVVNITNDLDQDPFLQSYRGTPAGLGIYSRSKSVDCKPIGKATIR